MADTPCRVRRVVVRGNNHTHDSVVRQELHGLKDARTLGEIGNHCADAIVKFLCPGKEVPSRIVNIANEALSTPQGQSLRTMIE